MRSFLSEEQVWILIGILLVSLGVIFSWYEVRPSHIISTCTEASIESAVKHYNIVTCHKDVWEDANTSDVVKTKCNQNMNEGGSWHSTDIRYSYYRQCLLRSGMDVEVLKTTTILNAF